MAPVMSSVTVASTVRSPSARSPISFSKTQDGILVALVFLGGLFRAPTRLAHVDHTQHQQGGQGQQGEQDGETTGRWPAPMP
jgi:hypothetical protein